jgi:hypothetical protein
MPPLPRVIPQLCRSRDGEVGAVSSWAPVPARWSPSIKGRKTGVMGPNRGGQRERMREQDKTKLTYAVLWFLIAIALGLIGRHDGGALRAGVLQSLSVAE